MPKTDTQDGLTFDQLGIGQRRGEAGFSLRDYARGRHQDIREFEEYRVVFPEEPTRDRKKGVQAVNLPEEDKAKRLKRLKSLAKPAKHKPPPKAFKKGETPKNRQPKDPEPS